MLPAQQPVEAGGDGVGEGAEGHEEAPHEGGELRPDAELVGAFLFFFWGGDRDVCVCAGGRDRGACFPSDSRIHPSMASAHR